MCTSRTAGSSHSAEVLPPQCAHMLALFSKAFAAPLGTQSCSGTCAVVTESPGSWDLQECVYFRGRSVTSWALFSLSLFCNSRTERYPSGNQHLQEHSRKGHRTKKNNVHFHSPSPDWHGEAVQKRHRSFSHILRMISLLILSVVWLYNRPKLIIVWSAFSAPLSLCYLGAVSRTHSVETPFLNEAAASRHRFVLKSHFSILGRKMKLKTDFNKSHL